MRRPSAYRVFLTRSTEYHVRGRVCCGVRDRRTGQWLLEHPAIHGRLASSTVRGQVQAVATPLIGETLFFEGGAVAVRTSPVLSVEEREGLLVGDASWAVEALRCVSPPRTPRDTY